ncbi:DUF305 domain-containing protein [Bradyrhizobium sp. 930_D9_N1_4]|uniref:DUF305 domain-containing protein n=1 Tax=Bradyrhizobium sp. 930_D9_N1_4 TaxID=3240374 RepID=UPI003F88A9F2
MTRHLTMRAGSALLVTVVAVIAFVAGCQWSHPSGHLLSIMSELCGDEAPFVAENRAAMQRMMDGMAIEPSGDVDRDFSTMMIAHHQGAIEMAQAELRHGRNELLRRIAQEIVVEQQQEIAAMRLARGESLARSTASPDRAVQSLAPVKALSYPTTVASTAPRQ